MGERKFGWSIEDMKQQIQTGIDHKIIKEIMFQNRLSYRVIELPSVVINDYVCTVSCQTDWENEQGQGSLRISHNQNITRRVQKE